MRAWMIYLIAILIALSAISVRANDSGYSSQDKKNDLDNAAHCRALSSGFHQIKDGFACFNGDISADTINPPKMAIDTGKVNTLYINSIGGVTTAAMELGRSIYAKNVKVVLHEACFSSCANYLVPAAHDLVVQKGTIYGLHGSVFRSDLDFAKSEPALYEVPAGSPEWFTIIKETYAKYPEFHKKQVVKEGLYFTEIRVSEQYVTRYFEIDRNRRLYDNGQCGEIPPVSLIIGPKYLSEFYYGNILEFDWDVEAIKANPLFNEIFKPKYSIVFDNNLFPTMTPERGEINPLECFNIK